VGTVADRIENTKSYSGEAPVIVLDPVLRSSSGASLLAADALEIFRSRLIPRVQWMTPNWNELGVLTGMKVTSFDRAEMAGRKLAAEYAGLNVVVTGGDQEDPLDVAILADGSVHTFAGEHVATRSTHGTGCAFSSALMCALALGAAPVSAVRAAKDYVRGALLHAPGLGAGKGPMGLLWPLQVAEPAGNLVP
jgi:hydroxymethylpyrimidine/phosphomethylpyrimidine kinase